MTDLDKVYEFVRDKLAPNYTSSPDHRYINDFLHAILISKETNSLRLLICMGVDIKTYDKRFCTTNKECDCLIDLLRKVILNIKSLGPFPKSYSKAKTITKAIEFGTSLKSCTTHDECKPSIQVTNGTDYMRLLPFHGYMMYVVKPNKSFNSIRGPIEESEMGRYYYEFKNFNKYSDLIIEKLGSGTGWVFIGSLNELKVELTNKNLEKVIDGFGFYIENVNPLDSYVWIKYPNNFTELAFQPTTLTGDWGNFSPYKIGNEYFMSYFMSDEWGRTFSVSGINDFFKERTHIFFDNSIGKNYRFGAYDMGQLSVNIAKANPDKIIEEALNRFKLA